MDMSRGYSDITQNLWDTMVVLRTSLEVKLLIKTAFRDKIYKKIKETTGGKIKKNYEKNVKERKKQGTLVN